MNAHIPTISRAGWSRIGAEHDVDDASAVLGHPMLADVLRLWRGLCSKGQLPLRENLDALILQPGIFPQIALLEGVERCGRRDLRYRLIGIGIANNLGADLTGRYVRDVFDNQTYAEELISVCWQVIDREQPIATVGQFLTADPGGSPTTVHRLGLPMRPLPSGTPLLLACQVCVVGGEIVERPVRHLTAYVPGNVIAFVDRGAGKASAK
ncbi:MAG: PAS domain-containing protein [Alphaproteobacteria bacterium]|nr:PAS domain-containing protein [Alphaproteobacteria bacterium]